MNDDRLAPVTFFLVMGIASFCYSVQYRVPLYLEACKYVEPTKPGEDVDPEKVSMALTFLTTNSPEDLLGYLALTYWVMRLFVLALICSWSLHIVSGFSGTWIGSLAGRLLVLSVSAVAFLYGGGGLDWLNWILESTDGIIRQVPVIGWVWVVLYGIVCFILGLFVLCLMGVLWLVHWLAGFVAYMLSLVFPLSASVTIVSSVPAVLFLLMCLGSIAGRGRD